MAQPRAAGHRGWIGLRLDDVLGRALHQQRATMWVLIAMWTVTSLVIWLIPGTPLTAMMVPMTLAQMFLAPRILPRFVAACLASIVIAALRDDSLSVRIVLGVVIQFLLGGLFVYMSLRRTHAGVATLRGEAMLVDLRDRIQGEAGVSGLPDNWHVQSELRSAGGTPFAGDFVVSAVRGDRLDLVVVDVSGKGEEAGTRALLLTGALRGLIAALPPERFLVEANRFLVHEDWAEGFATAVHLSLHLPTGRYELRSAGHPPAATWHAGSGRWEVVGGEGPVLGLIDDVDYEPVSGHVRPGDALMLFTDGMVESRQLDLARGIDRLLGEAERQLRGAFEGAAATLIDRQGSPHDDRALVVIHRR